MVNKINAYVTKPQKVIDGIQYLPMLTLTTIPYLNVLFRKCYHCFEKMFNHTC